MLEYRLCLLLQLNTWPSNITIVEGDKVDTLAYKYMTVKHHNCRRRQRRYSNIQIHDLQTSQVFVSFYNCDVRRSCICMLEFRLCLLLQLWCLTVIYLYVGVSSLSLWPSYITIVEGDKVDTPTYKYMTVKHHNCRRRQRRYSNIQIYDRQTSQL
jgi:hypothetical protein